MQDTFTPVAYEYREVIAEQMEKETRGKVFFFDNNDQVEEALGLIIACEEINGEGIFITLDNNFCIRIDRIITLFGKPGASFDRYDALANTCLDCTGGYPL
jgi:hypothetical protein